MQNLLTIREAAEKLSVSRPTVYRLIKDGELSVIKVRSHKRIREEDLQAYVRLQTEQAIPND